jgi:hypothetical protein
MIVHDVSERLNVCYFAGSNHKHVSGIVVLFSLQLVSGSVHRLFNTV